MTIAIALLTRDGSIVMASDTLVTGGYLKSDEIKTVSVDALQVQLGSPNPIPTNPYGGCLFAGAGDAGYVDTLVEKLRLAFTEDAVPNGVALQSKFESCLTDFHKQHVIPFLVLHEPPEVFMLIGVHRGGAPMIYVTDKSTIRQRLPYASIGIGAEFADPLAQRYMRSAMETPQAQIFATYIVFRVKESVDRCGNYTTVTTIRPPEIKQTTGPVYSLSPYSSLSWDYVDHLERLFRSKWIQEEHDLIWRLISESPPPPMPSSP